MYTLSLPGCTPAVGLWGAERCSGLHCTVVIMMADQDLTQEPTASFDGFENLFNQQLASFDRRKGGCSHTDYFDFPVPFI